MCKSSVLRECVHIRLRAWVYLYKLLLTEIGKSGNISIDGKKHVFIKINRKNMAL